MDLSSLRRLPDIEGPGLPAVDAADRLLLDEAANAIAGAGTGHLVVIDDAYGALTLGALTLGAADLGATDLGAADLGARAVRVHQDLLTGERALAINAEALGVDDFASQPCNADLVAGATVVLMRLPRSLDRLAEVAALIAAHADPSVRVFAGGRIKHMTPRMNDVLRTVFGRVDVSHARQKSRVLIAGEPRRSVATELCATWPARARHDDADLVVAVHGGVFAGTGIDIGTRFLLDHLDAMPDVATAVDLACGSGVIATVLARRRPGIAVLASDRSAAAVASARATAELNGVGDQVRVVQADGLATVSDESEHLVVLNPPFHSDAALSTAIAEHLFDEAGRVLAPGGELWCVWNSHLRYRPVLARIVGPTRQIARNPKFTVTASRRPDRS